MLARQGRLLARAGRALGSSAASKPLAPFHLAFPVNNLQASREFYGNVLGCQEGRSSNKWIDFSLCARRYPAPKASLTPIW